jgi:4-hydroxybenzoate polyprenyltransferase
MPFSKVWTLLVGMRVRQWIKNLLVFAAIIFAQKLGHFPSLGKVCGAFAVFCLVSSGVYLINDVIDAEQDKRHPLKAQRPVASGKISEQEALVWAIGLTVVGMAGGFGLDTHFGYVLFAYLALQMAYVFWLKHVVVLDVLSVALGFVLRAIGGAVVIAVEFSHWLLFCTMFLALFLVVCKRRHELVLLGENSGEHRRSLEHYSPAMLDQMVGVVTSSTVVSYALYTVSPSTIAKFGGDQLKYTLPFVLYGVFRYLYLVYRMEKGGTPESSLLGDGPLMINLVLYGFTAAALVYWR